MQNIFFIFGYGVPKDIVKDSNYIRYLSFCFNYIFDRAESKQAQIVFCGGKTDCFKPYERTEAVEMKKFFTTLLRKSYIKKQTRLWKLKTIGNTLNTLENVLGAQKYTKLHNLQKSQVTIFCEYTRAGRVRHLVKQVFGNKKAAWILNIHTAFHLLKYFLFESRDLHL